MSQYREQQPLPFHHPFLLPSPMIQLGSLGNRCKLPHALARDCSPRRSLPGDDVILPRPLPVCMQMRSKGQTLRSNISGTERARRKILSPHDHSPQPLPIPPYHLYLRFRVWGSEPQNPKFTFFDRNFFFVNNFFYKSFYAKRVRVSSD